MSGLSPLLIALAWRLFHRPRAVPTKTPSTVSITELPLFVFRLVYSTVCARTAFVLQDPKAYVQTVLDVHKKYNALVVTAFNRDAGFVAALDKVSLSSAL